jgi:hypothetical protein
MGNIAIRKRSFGILLWDCKKKGGKMGYPCTWRRVRYEEYKITWRRATYYFKEVFFRGQNKGIFNGYKAQLPAIEREPFSLQLCMWWVSSFMFLLRAPKASRTDKASTLSLSLLFIYFPLTPLFALNSAASLTSYNCCWSNITLVNLSSGL